ncbi:uncharacterized protein LOC123266772 isoform X3 [Cotesia glomerata]|uniref:uncharacterized protein LOC123266772 isoform X3 n=1 Tax=Cotesia glomerata TaxID=32391 RepID=UPI001D00A8ED|nr:uncharacterized protein LOC123266772 isoform X3 [Cotesia glomerata]
MSESDEEDTGYIQAEAQYNTYNSITPKSNDDYYRSYQRFMDWTIEKKVENLTEDVFLEYFKEISNDLAPSTLWSKYSMINTVVNQKHGINLQNFAELKTFLKDKNKGFQSKKSEILTWDEINTFLTTAVDEVYLDQKVILILGFCGAMRCKELCNLNYNDIEDIGSKFIVSVPDAKNVYPRSFVIMNQFYNIVKKYVALRPDNCAHERFLLCYRSGYCIRQPIGKNKISNVPQNIAKFLNLPNPPAYTGHCFRRTSTSLLGNSGASHSHHPPAKKIRSSGVSSNLNQPSPQPSASTSKSVHELKTNEDSIPSPTHNIKEFDNLDFDSLFEPTSNNHPTAESTKQKKESTKGTRETLNLDGFKFVVVEIDRRIEVVQKGWSPPEGAEYVKPHAIFDSYKSASDYADTINAKKTPRVAPSVAPSQKVISIDADSSNCPEPNTQEIRKVVKSGLPIRPINVVKNRVAPTSTPGSSTPKRIIGTLVKKNDNQRIQLTSANGLKTIVNNKRFIGTLVNQNFNKNSIVSNKQNLNSQNAKSGNVFIVVEKVDNSSNVITGDVSGNANPPMQVDTKDPTLTSTMSDSYSLEEPPIDENPGIKEEFVNEEMLEEDELMAVDPLAF